MRNQILLCAKNRNKKFFKKSLKKVLTFVAVVDIINKRSKESEKQKALRMA